MKIKDIEFFVFDKILLNINPISQIKNKMRKIIFSNNCLLNAITDIKKKKELQLIDPLNNKRKKFNTLTDFVLHTLIFVQHKVCRRIHNFRARFR